MVSFDVSVVIGFRNWGHERLRLALSSIQAAFGACRGEVILVDYGSTDPEPARAAAESTDSRLVRIDDVKVWSRSGALNAGFAHARGRLLISTDADMLFAPGTVETVYAWWLASGTSALYLQCRDLPPSLTVDDLSAGQFDWKELEAVARLRPRWGVGGMMAIDRRSYGVLRGFDERMHTYGREDMDFASRARRAGLRMVWIEDPKARIYHMWHPSSAEAIRDSPEAVAAVKRNRSIFEKDRTAARNRTLWHGAIPDATPLISICLLDGCESLEKNGLGDTIALQTVRDVEVLMPSTGKPAEQTTIDSIVREVDCQVGDLNAMLAKASGRYTIALDSRYILPDTFLEELLADASGTVRVVVPRRMDFSPEPNEFGVVPVGEPTGVETFLGVLTQTDILRAVVREQDISKFYQGFVEIFKGLGVQLVYSDNAICLVDSKAMVRPLAHEHEVPSEIRRIIDALPPGNDTGRVVRITDGPIEVLAGKTFDGALDFSVIKRDGETTSKLGILGNPSLNDLARLRNLGCHFTAVQGPSEQAEFSGQGIQWIISEALVAIDELGVVPHAVIVVESEFDDQPCEDPDQYPLTIRVERIDLNVHQRVKLFLCADALESSIVLNNNMGMVRFILSNRDWEM